ncbi:hypothetical protein ACFVUS_32415 [Nocardia sp. NPDC058058]|uniref:hypothetical protein n=1 Tax=Nocardia sp. NPDC058058 TaxID=3346317 RepID=UPI0036DA32CB
MWDKLKKAGSSVVNAVEHPSTVYRPVINAVEHPSTVVPVIKSGANAVVNAADHVATVVEHPSAVVPVIKNGANRVVNAVENHGGQVVNAIEHPSVVVPVIKNGANRVVNTVENAAKVVNPLSSPLLADIPNTLGDRVLPWLGNQWNNTDHFYSPGSVARKMINGTNIWGGMAEDVVKDLVDKHNHEGRIDDWGDFFTKLGGQAVGRAAGTFGGAFLGRVVGGGVGEVVGGAAGEVVDPVGGGIPGALIGGIVGIGVGGATGGFFGGKYGSEYGGDWALDLKDWVGDRADKQRQEPADPRPIPPGAPRTAEPPTRQPNIPTIPSNPVPLPEPQAPPLPRAAGGSISAGDVKGPGSSIGDKIPAYLSDGEFVVKAASASVNRPLLKAINDDPLYMKKYMQQMETMVASALTKVRATPNGPQGRGQQVDRSMTVRVSTYDVHEAFAKAKLWELRHTLLD